MTFEYTTTQDVANEIRASSDFASTTTPTDTTVTGWIQEASEKINLVSGRTWGTSQYTEEIDYDGADRIQLKYAPIITVDTVLYNKNPLGSESGTDYEAKTEDSHYSVYKNKGEILILRNRWNPLNGPKRIKVTYTAGFATIPSYVQELATKEVALRTIQSVLYNNVEGGDTGGSISVGQISIVEPDNLSVGTVEKIKADVNELWTTVKGTGVYRYTNY